MRDHRQRRGLTVDQLAVLAGINPGTIRRAEAGERMPSGRVVRALAQALEVEVGELVDDGGPITLKQIRQRLGLTQRQVAEAIGMSTQMVSRVETGVYGVSDPARWASAYRLTPEQWTAAWQAGRDARRRSITGS
jgi:transcriptional regulator with XRE-family HTH domain